MSYPGIAGKVAVVTGAGGGIGEGYARALVAEGAKVVIAEIDEQKGGAVADSIKTGGGEALCTAAGRFSLFASLVSCTLAAFDCATGSAGAMFPTTLGEGANSLLRLGSGSDRISGAGAGGRFAWRRKRSSLPSTRPPLSSRERSS